MAGHRYDLLACVDHRTINGKSLASNRWHNAPFFGCFTIAQVGNHELEVEGYDSEAVHRQPRGFNPLISMQEPLIITVRVTENLFCFDVLMFLRTCVILLHVRTEGLVDSITDPFGPSKREESLVSLNNFCFPDGFV